MKTLYYEWQDAVVGKILEDENVTYNDLITIGANACPFDNTESQWWLDKYIQMVCHYHGYDETFDNYKNLVRRAHEEQGKTKAQIVDLKFSIFTPEWDLDDKIQLYRNDQLYREFKRTTVDLTEKPSGLQTIHFNQTKMTVQNGVKKVMVSISKWSWLFNLDDMPNAYKHCYTTQLKLQNMSIPDELQAYSVSTFDCSEVYFEVNLNNGEEI